MTILSSSGLSSVPSASTQVNAEGLTHRLRSLAQRPASLTVRDLIQRYMAQYCGRDVTRGQRLSAWMHLIGDFEISQVDPDVVHAGRTELAAAPPLIYMGLDHRGQQIFKVKGGRKQKSPATLNRYVAALSSVITWAIDQRLTPKGYVHPCRGIKRIRESDGRVRYLEDDERSRLFDACRQSRYPRMFALVLTAMKTGARRGELLGLRWSDVDLDAGLAYLDRSKNGDRKTLILLPDVVEVLRPFKSSDARRYVFGSVRSRYQQPADIGTTWKEAVARAQLRDFKFHDLRHTCASYLVQKGVDLSVVAEVLGHRQLTMTRRYAHLKTETKAAAMAAALGAIQ